MAENDMSSDSSEIVVHFPRAATAFAAAASIIFIIIGVAGNLVTILALSRSVKLRMHATTAFVISLCISDLLFCTINLPLTASRYIHEEWVLGEALCRIFPFFFYGNVASSLLNMVAITLNRYILIAHHQIYDVVYQRRNILIMIAAIWIFCFGMMTPPLLGIWGKLGLDPPSFSCTILKKNGSSPKKFLFMFGFLVPMIAIIVCYSAIYYKVRQSRLKTKKPQQELRSLAPTSPIRETQAKKDDMRLTRMMLIIFICFLLSFFPLMIVNVADDKVKYPLAHLLASVLAWASAVLNPFVYAFTNRNYRIAYRKLFGIRDSHMIPPDYSKSSNSRTVVTTDFHYQANTGVISPSSTLKDVSEES